MKIVIASNNAGKIRELNHLLGALDIELLPQNDLDVTEVPETGLTFIENALIKARHACQVTGFPAIADDSGLTVSALRDAPGIYSARYAGTNATMKDNIQKLLNELAALPLSQRAASFHCALVYMRHEQDPSPIVCEGTWNGYILTEPRGEDGFGYDPIFYVPDENKSAAELSMEEKNRLSHRGQAMRLLVDRMRK